MHQQLFFWDIWFLLFNCFSLGHEGSWSSWLQSYVGEIWSLFREGKCDLYPSLSCYNNDEWQIQSEADCCFAFAGIPEDWGRSECGSGEDDRWLAKWAEPTAPGSDWDDLRWEWRQWQHVVRITEFLKKKKIFFIHIGPKILFQSPGDGKIHAKIFIIHKILITHKEM